MSNGRPQTTPGHAHPVREYCSSTRSGSIDQHLDYSLCNTTCDNAGSIQGCFDEQPAILGTPDLTLTFSQVLQRPQLLVHQLRPPKRPVQFKQRQLLQDPPTPFPHHQICSHLQVLLPVKQVQPLLLRRLRQQTLSRLSHQHQPGHSVLPHLLTQTPQQSLLERLEPSLEPSLH